MYNAIITICIFALCCPVASGCSGAKRSRQPPVADCLAFSQDGSFIAYSSVTTEDWQSNSINVCDGLSGRFVRSLLAHKSQVTGLAFSPADLVSGGCDGSVFVWDTKTWSITDTFHHDDVIHRLSVSRNGLYLAVNTGFTERTQITIYGRKNKTNLKLACGHGTVNDMAFSPDSKLLVIAWNEPIISIIESSSGRVVKHLQCKNPTGQDAIPWALCISPDGRLVAVATASKNVHLFITRDWTQLHSLQEGPWIIKSLTFSPDCRYLATGPEGPMEFKHVNIWDISTGRIAGGKRIMTEGAPVVRFSPNQDDFTAGQIVQKDVVLYRVADLIGTAKDR